MSPDARPQIPVLRRALTDPEQWDGGVRELVEICGGIDALERLRVDPLLDEPFDWTSIPDGDRALVGDLLDLIEPVADAQLDPEYRTILRRLLARAARRADRPLHGRASLPRRAAALVWVAMKANDDLGRRHRWNGADLWWWFGVSDCGALARKLAGELDLLRPDLFPYFDSSEQGLVYAGDVGLLHARRRQHLVMLRDETVGVLERLEAREAAERKVVLHPGGKVELRGEQSRCALVAKAIGEEGRAMVSVVVGESVFDPAHVLAFSVPDARDLLHRLQLALDGPMVNA